MELDCRVVNVKTVSRLLPQYLDDSLCFGGKSLDLSGIFYRATIDLSHLFWSELLETKRLEALLFTDNHSTIDADTNIKRQIDIAALKELKRASNTISVTSERMPSAADLLFSYRVIRHCANLASIAEEGYYLHFARGLVVTEVDSYDLEVTEQSAAFPKSTSVGRLLASLLGKALDHLHLNVSSRAPIVILNLRNDGEFYQAVLLASLFKQINTNSIIVLDASGANEQFNFAQWSLLFKSRPVLAQYINYFLPKQDYKGTLHTLIDCLLSGRCPEVGSLPNLDVLCSPRDAKTVFCSTPDLNESFSKYQTSSQTFRTAGKTTMLARLAPTRCHWSGCSFCTINSQHPLPQGLTILDDSASAHLKELLDLVEQNKVESLILMDEALHPNILRAFANSVLKRELKLVYRARARFSNELDREMCKLLYDSGCRYLGMGLEAISDRVNRLINKHRGSEIFYDSILKNLDEVGIRPHIYAILGFPTETADEIVSTADFLLHAIRQYKYVTVSPNLFYLMRGSAMANRPSDFNIKLMENSQSTRLVIDFFEAEHSQNRALAHDMVRSLHRAQFLPQSDDMEFAEEFWHFVDQSGIFYVQKVVHTHNPYRELAKCYEVDSEASLECSTSLEYLFSFEVDGATGQSMIGCWITNKYAFVPSWFATFLMNVKDKDTILANIRETLPNLMHQDAMDICLALLDGGLLSLKSLQAGGQSRESEEEIWVGA